MPLSDNDKAEARDSLALALELNEPETMIEGLKRLCAGKLAGRLSDRERDRWRSAHDALQTVAEELKRANAPQMRDNDAQAAQVS